jgi:hypothetical protein
MLWDIKKVVFDSLGYTPHEGQEPAHASKARLLGIFGAERAGKSRFGAAAADCALADGGDVAVAGQDYDSTRPEMEYIVEDLQKMQMVLRSSTPRQGKWTIDTKFGGRVESVSLKDGAVELTATGRAYDLVIVAEAGRVAHDTLTSAWGRVSETRGRVLLIGTLWDNWGWYADLYRMLKGPNPYDGEGFSFPAWYNLAIYPEGRDDPQIKLLEATLTPDEFARRVAAKLIPSPAQMFPEFDQEIHVKELEFDKTSPVHVTVDAGYYPSHYAVLAIQTALNSSGMEVLNIIDEIWVNHQTHQDVIEEAKSRPWWDQVEREYGGHETRQHQAAKSTKEVWEELALSAKGARIPFTVVDAGKILDGIPRVQTFLKDPMTKEPRLFLDVKCTGTAEEFRKYKRRTNRIGEVTSDQPEDKNNDAMDALRNYIVGRFGYADPLARPWRPPAPRARGSIG